MLTLGEGVNLVEELAAHLADIKQRLGEISATIACDCIQRRVELERKRQLNTASEILAAPDENPRSPSVS